MDFAADLINLILNYFPNQQKKSEKKIVTASHINMCYPLLIIGLGQLNPGQPFLDHFHMTHMAKKWDFINQNHYYFKNALILLDYFHLIYLISHIKFYILASIRHMQTNTH